MHYSSRNSVGVVRVKINSKAGEVGLGIGEMHALCAKFKDSATVTNKDVLKRLRT